MSEFNWVDARAACSLARVFQRLRLEIEADVEVRNSKRSANPYYAFSVEATSGSILVKFNGKAIPSSSVMLKLGEKAISVHDGHNQLLIEATLTLSDAGQCRLKVNDQEKEFWQFRRMALEKLFFESVPREEF